MLDFMRRQAQGWIVKVLFALIVMSFAMWGVGDYFSGQSSVKVAEVGGQTITQQALQQRVRQERDRLRRLLGSDFSPEPRQFQTRVLRQMVRSRLLDLEAARLGLTATDAAVREAIRSQPGFQQGGRFSSERYRTLIQRMGMGPTDYEARTRRDLAVGHLRDFVRQGTVVADGEAWRAFRRENERRSVAFFRLSPAAFAEQVTLGEQALRAYYRDNQADYRRPAQVKVRYVLLSPEALADGLDPDPGELERFFRDSADRYAEGDGGVPELAEVRHRVLADWRRQAAVDRIYERLPTFKDLLYTRDELTPAAEEFGLEVRTSPWIPRKGDLPQAIPQADAFRQAAFRVQPGRNSEALELGDGRFVGLQPVERREPTVRDFTEVKAQVRRDLRREEARQLAREGAEEARRALAGGRPIAEVAADYGAEVETVAGIKRSDRGADLPSGLAGAVFAAAEGAAGKARVGGSDLAVFRVTEVAAPERRELTADQRRSLAEQLRRQRGEARMEALYERLRKRYQVRVRQEQLAGRG